MICREVAFHGGIPDTGFYRFWTQGIFARWTDNPNIEDLIQAQQEHPLFDDLETASSAIITN